MEKLATPTADAGFARGEGPLRDLTVADGPVPRRSALLDEAGFRHAFFTREGGVSLPPWASLSFAISVGDDPAHVRENLRRAARALGVEADKLYMLSQVHGTASRVLRGDEDPAGERLLAGGREEAIDIRLLNTIVGCIKFALDRVDFVRTGCPGDQC